MRNPITTALAAASVAIACVSTLAAIAADPAPQPVRMVLEQHVGTDIPTKEITLGTAQIPAGTVIGWHTHDGDESGYVVSGELVLRSRGQPDRLLKAGDHFFNPRGLVHSVAAAPNTPGGTVLSTWIIDKGKPLSEPAN